jgi:hypothetical protein
MWLKSIAVRALTFYIYNTINSGENQNLIEEKIRAPNDARGVIISTDNRKLGLRQRG